MIAGIAGSILLLAWLLLVGRGVLARRRAGEPIDRYAMIWGGAFALLFVVAFAIDRR